jgi:signal transduction histidine kinase
MTRRLLWRRIQDAAVAVLIAVMGLLEIWVPFESVQGVHAPVRSTIVVVCCAILLALRREWPIVLIGIPLVWVAVAMTLGGQIPVLFFGGFVVVAFALYSTARHASPRVALVVCGTTFAAVVAADLTAPALQGPEELIFHWSAFLLAVGIGWGLRVSERRAVDAAVRAGEAEAAAREEALQAVADERARIARELHDILGHSVSVMVVQAGAAAQVVDDDPAFVRRALEAIRTTGTQALDEVRRTVDLLRTDKGSALAPQPGLGELPALLDQVRADGLHVDFEQHGAPRLSPGQELALYRVVQESLTNVRKHADASRVRVCIDGRADGVAVTVIDDGRRRETRTTSGHGLVGMRERVTTYGGEFDAGPDPAGSGWRVRVSLPLQTTRDAFAFAATS